MLESILTHLLSVVKTQWEKLHCYQTIVLSALFVSCVSWILWRLWTFTILPLFHPREPKELPYWIPIFGHAGSFFKNSHKLVARALARLDNGREPFAMTVMGKKYYVFSAPPHANDFYSNLSVFNWDDFLNDVLIGFGVDPNRTDVMWQKSETPSAVNPASKCLIHLTQDIYKHFLLPGATFNVLTDRYKSALFQLTSWKRLACRYGLKNASESWRLSLYDLCASIAIDATQLTLFDPGLFIIDPTMTERMRFFTDDLWKLMYPSWFTDSKEVTSIRENWKKNFMIYQSLPKESRAGESSMVTLLIDQHKELGIKEEDSAAMLVMVYWAGDANAYKLTFWIMAYILFDQRLHASILAETAPAFHGGEIDLHYLAQNCEELKSIYNEVLRLTKRDFAFRKLEKDTEIGGRLLRKGNLAIVPVCQLHENETVFGENTAAFQPHRFLQKQDLGNNPSYRPFGSGKTFCPGRFFAMHEVFGFVATLLHRLDIQLESGPQNFPLADESLLTLGVSRPLPGSDLWVTLSDGPRTQRSGQNF